jgi:hypothetical protein
MIRAGWKLKLEEAERKEVRSLISLIVKISLIFGVIVILGLIGLRFVHAHDHWISANRLTDPASGEWCCNHIDCQAEKVSEVAGGYLTQAGDVVPHARIIWKSQDGSWWRCRNMRTNATRCLIGPPPGS